MDKNLSVVTYKDNKFAPMELTKIAGYVILICVAFVFFCLWPLAIIWALNTLFNLSILYTFWTWLAGVVLLITLQTISIKKEK